MESESDPRAAYMLFTPHPARVAALHVAYLKIGMWRHTDGPRAIRSLLRAPHPDPEHPERSGARVAADVSSPVLRRVPRDPLRRAGMTPAAVSSAVHRQRAHHRFPGLKRSAVRRLRQKTFGGFRHGRYIRPPILGVQACGLRPSTYALRHAAPSGLHLHRSTSTPDLDVKSSWPADPKVRSGGASVAFLGTFGSRSIVWMSCQARVLSKLCQICVFSTSAANMLPELRKGHTL